MRVSAAVANRYAKALVDVALQKREEAQVREELSGFLQLLASNEELRNVFASPAIPHAQKRAILEALISRLKLNKTTANFLEVLLKNNRLHQLEAMVEAFARELDNRLGIVSAEITTARPVSDNQKNLLIDRLRRVTGKEVRLKFKTEPELIGGVVTRIGSTIYDGSIRTQLQTIRKQMSEG